MARPININHLSVNFSLQIGYLKKGLNPPSLTSLTFSSPYMMVSLKAGLVTGIIALAVSSIKQ